MGPEDLDRARQIFVDHSGSTFYMSRNGVEDEYRRFAVPKQVEAEWLAELKAQWLAAIDDPGNWRTISLLEHHSDYAPAVEVLRARPRGVLWQQCAFLEHYVTYARAAFKRGVISRSEVFAARNSAIHSAQRLATRSRSEASRRRVEAILASAETLGKTTLTE